MKFKVRSDSSLKKKARRGFRGYSITTIAWYGPDDQRASKVAVGILISEGTEPVALQRWFAEERDIRRDYFVAEQIREFVTAHGVKSVAMSDQIIGCPHEEGKDYPDGEVCPHCPFWAHRDRWTGEMLP